MRAKSESHIRTADSRPGPPPGQAGAGVSEHGARLRILFETMTEGVVLIDPDGQVVEANPAAERILGLTRSEITGRNYVSPNWRILRPDGTPMPAEEMAGPRAMSERRPIRDVVMGVEHPDGSIAWISVSASPIVNPAGELEGVVGTFTDITERKLIEEALQYSERNYRTLVESLPQKVFLKDRDSVYISCNGRYAEDHNIEPEDIPGHTDYDFYPADLAGKYIADDRRVMQSGETAKFEERYIENGRERIVETFKTPVKDDDGNIVGLLGIFHDITERKEAEEALRRSEEENRAIVEVMPDMIFRLGRHGEYLDIKSYVDDKLAMPERELMRKTIQDVLPPESSAPALESIRRAIATNEVQTVEYVLDVPGGKKTFEARISRLNKDEVLTFVRDITERREAEEAREEAERNYRLLAENTTDVVSIFDLDLNLVWVSPSVENQTGYTPDEMKKIPPLETMTPESIERVIESFNRAKQLYEQGKEFADRFEAEGEVYRKDGSTFWADIRYRLIRDGNGDPMYILMQGRDITEHRKTDEALRKSEERYRLITDNTSDCIWVMGPDLRITYQSPSTERVFGYTAEEWEAVGFRGWVHPDYIDTVVSTLKGINTGDTRDSITITVQARHKSGHFFWMEICASPIRGTDGQLVGVAGVSRDVTERKEAEDRLLEYRTAVEQSADGIALVDLEGKVRFMNEAWAGMHGYAVEELIGRHLSIFHTREQMELQVIPFIDILRDKGSNEGEVWHVRRNGETFPAWMTTTILKREDGQPFGMFGLMRDITGQKEMEEQQRQREIAEARAEELSRSRERLIEAQESLRKDIASQLHGSVQNRLILLGHRLADLEAEPASERTTEELAGIRRSLEELQRDQIRPISHRLYPSILRLGIAAGLESMVDTYRSELPIDLQISNNLREGEQANRRLVPDNVKLALYRVAEEVLANVLKHASAVNSVVVKLTLSDGGILRLTVSDDGTGFDTAAPQNGIGLAIISDYAAAAGASCTVRSVPGRGTRVTAQVRLEATEARPRRKGRTSG